MLADTPLGEAAMRRAENVLPPAFWFTYPAGAVQLSPAETARLTRIGVKRGLPDMLPAFSRERAQWWRRLIFRARLLRVAAAGAALDCQPAASFYFGAADWQVSSATYR